MFVTVRREESVESVGSSLKILMVCGLKRQTGPQFISRKDSATSVSLREMVRKMGHPTQRNVNIYCLPEYSISPDITSLTMKSEMKSSGPQNDGVILG